jgi:flagellar biogenesis protein FliO
LELVGRLPLEARRAVYLVRVFDRVFVLGASEAGLEKLAELEGTNFITADDAKLSFKQALSRVLERNQRGVPSPGPREGSDATK